MEKIIKHLNSSLVPISIYIFIVDLDYLYLFFDMVVLRAAWSHAVHVWRAKFIAKEWSRTMSQSADGYSSGSDDIYDTIAVMFADGLLRGT